MESNMKIWRIISVLILLVAAVLFAGCGKPYIITDELKQPLQPGSACNMGSITDELPSDFDPAKKPSAENIDKLKKYLSDALVKKKVFSSFWTNNDDCLYEINGGILDYEKGSSFLRFMFGSLAGSARITVTLRLVDKKTNVIIFSGNFNGKVSSWQEEGDQMFQRVASNFAKELKKEMKKLNKTG
ncbi:hypothetical protein TRIP_C90435 [Candidatus Zixiibacteriota bacterium]|nr:hypothetical protein TRIP_C90435 [candidate division Zixibacteria bacterium]